MSSHSWLKDAKLLGLDIKKEYDSKTGIAEYDMDWDDLKQHLPYIKYWKLAGGEPTIMEGTYQLLEELVRVGNTDCFISLITNGTTIQYGKHNLIDLLANFSYVSIQISLEGMGARHEWARSGKKDWTIIESNIEKFIKICSQKQWKLNIHSGISWMNMYHMADFIQKYSDVEFIFNIVQNPKEMSISNFYKSDLQECSEYYAGILNDTQTGLVADHLKIVKKAIDKALATSDETIDMDKFRSTQEILDKSRNQNFIEAYPEWRKYA